MCMHIRRWQQQADPSFSKLRQNFRQTLSFPRFTMCPRANSFPPSIWCGPDPRTSWLCRWVLRYPSGSSTVHNWKCIVCGCDDSQNRWMFRNSDSVSSLCAPNKRRTNISCFLQVIQVLQLMG